jgi:TRAP-type uncharacterized transport system substrate-binding protein
MIGEIADLAGHKVGIIGRTGANVALLRTILEGSGVQPDKVATAQFGTEEIEKLAQDATLDAYLFWGVLMVPTPGKKETRRPGSRRGVFD